MDPRITPFRLAAVVLYMTVPLLSHAAGPEVCWHALGAPATAPVPMITQAFAGLNLGMTPAEAGAQSERLRALIHQAGKVARAGDLDGAVRLLGDERVLEGSGFRLAPERPSMSLDPAGFTDERSYARQLKNEFSPRPSVSAKGLVVLPRLPPRTTWARRAFIRIAAEELGHVAQLLGERAHPDQRVISQQFGGPDREIMRALNLTNEAVNQRLREDGRDLIIYETDEADVYAVLIEALGFDLVPWWFGKDSGYIFRQFFVDDRLTARGVPDRAWRP